MRCVSTLLCLSLPPFPLTLVSTMQKNDTVNRLLNKQVGRTSGAKKGGGSRQRSKLNKSVTADGGDGGEEADGDEVISSAAAKALAVEEERRRRDNIKPTVARWVSSIRSVAAPPPTNPSDAANPPPSPAEPSFSLTYSLPEGRALDLSMSLPPPVKKPRREPPVSRRFGEDEKREMRRLNEEGWRKVMLGAA